PRGKMGHARLLYVLVPLFLMAVGALVIKQPWFREPTSATATKAKAPLADDKVNDARPKPDDASGKPGLTPDCEKELRRTADLLKIFRKKNQGGKETQTILADKKKKKKRISAVCPDEAGR